MPDATVRELTFGDAIKEAIAQEMRRDPSVVLMGEDVAEAGTTFKVLVGLVEVANEQVDDGVFNFTLGSSRRVRAL